VTDVESSENKDGELIGATNSLKVNVIVLW